MSRLYTGGKIASDKRYYENNRKAISDRRKLIYRENPSPAIERSKAYQIAHKESVNAKNRTWININHEAKIRKRAKTKEWSRKNSALVSFYSREYQLLKIMAQPPWIKREDILPFYVEAHRRSLIERVDYQVDHIWPIKGDGFTGLHVPWNLRVITRSENARKKNRRPCE